jgi:hypothetical protein
LQVTAGSAIARTKIWMIDSCFTINDTIDKRDNQFRLSTDGHDALVRMRPYVNSLKLLNDFTKTLLKGLK